VNGYRTLKVRIEALHGDRYKAIVSWPHGEGKAEFELPFEDVEHDALAAVVGRPRSARRRIESDESAQARAFGERLFGLVFQDTASRVLDDALSQTRRNDEGLRMMLQLEGARGLQNVPWELLCDSTRFVSTSSYTPVLRYVDMTARPQPLPMCPPMRILGMVSSPGDVPPLDAEREREHLTDACRTLIERGILEIDWVAEATLGGLLRRLNEGDYHIFHFIGHGDFDEQAEDGVLLFEGRAGRSHRVTGVELGTILADQHTLRLAVINACEGARVALDSSGIAATLMRYGLPAVIAMQFEISDEAAVAFAEHFYASLARGNPIDEALGDARRGMFADGHGLEWATPVLSTSVDDGQLFEVDWTNTKRPEPVTESSSGTDATLGADATAGKQRDEVAGEQGDELTRDREASTLGLPAGVVANVESSGGPKGRPFPRRRFAAAVAVLAAVVALVLALTGTFSSHSGLSVGRPIPVKQTPVGIATGANRVWVTSLNTGYLSSIDASGGKSHELHLGDSPNGVAVDRDGYVWVVRNASDQVVVLDPYHEDRVVKRYRVGSKPNAIVLGFKSAWVANSADGTVSRIDLASVNSEGSSPREVIAEAGDQPSGIAVGQGSVWVASRGDGKVARIDPNAGTVTEHIAVGRSVRGIAVDDRAVWVTNPDQNTISLISPRGGREQVTETLPVGVKPTGVTVSGSGALTGIWVANNGGSVTWIAWNGTAYRKRAEVKLGREPNAIAVRFGAVWVTDLMENSVTPVTP
jgi:streptogramin lyase